MDHADKELGPGLKPVRYFLWKKNEAVESSVLYTGQNLSIAAFKKR
jgi:hypothetical protein